MTSEQTFTASDGRKLFFRHAVHPDQKDGTAHPKGIVVILHGYGEHSGRYLETMERFAEAGYVVYAPDHRGFGHNACVFGDVESFERIGKDVHELTTLAQEEFPATSTVLVGHSLGGLLAINQLLNYQNDYDAAITSGAAVLLPPDAGPLMIATVRALARLFPKLPVQKLDLSEVTRNEEIKERDETDDLIYGGKVRARTGYETLKAQKTVMANLAKITLPILVLHGGSDVVINSKASTLIHDGVSSRKKELVIFPGLYHEIFGEPERDQVFGKMFTWLDDVLNSEST